MSNNALIGYSGFVGSNLLAAQSFEALYNSSNIQDIVGKSFDRVVCAGVTAVKWWANQNPEEDRLQIERLMECIGHVEAESFTLISTVDVYVDPRAVDESTSISLVGLHPYGRNRVMLEDFVARRFPRHLIVRLPALFGPGLKKNAIYDLQHDNRLEVIHPESHFQWYPLGRLWADLNVAIHNNVELLNLSAEPIAMRDIAGHFFPGKSLGAMASPPIAYDMRSRHDHLFGGSRGYVVSHDQVMDALARFLRETAA